MPSDRLYLGCNGRIAAIKTTDGYRLWMTKLPGGLIGSSGNATVLDHDGKVYAGCNGHLFCLDAETGQILWKNPLEGMGYGAVTLTLAGKSVQFISTTEGQTLPT